MALLPVMMIDWKFDMKPRNSVLKKVDNIKNKIYGLSLNKELDNKISPLIKSSIDTAYCIINSIILKEEEGTIAIFMAIQILMNELLQIEKQGIKDEILSPLIRWCYTILKWEE